MDRNNIYIMDGVRIKGMLWIGFQFIMGKRTYFISPDFDRQTTRRGGHLQSDQIEHFYSKNCMI